MWYAVKENETICCAERKFLVMDFLFRREMDVRNQKTIVQDGPFYTYTNRHVQPGKHPKNIYKLKSGYDVVTYSIAQREELERRGIVAEWDMEPIPNPYPKQRYFYYIVDDQKVVGTAWKKSQAKQMVCEWQNDRRKYNQQKFALLPSGATQYLSRRGGKSYVIGTKRQLKQEELGDLVQEYERTRKEQYHRGRPYRGKRVKIR